MLKIAMIPIDNRPVCYCLPAQICSFAQDIELVLPPRELLGGLTTYADTDTLLEWIAQLENTDILVIALDTIAYGGLVSSRRTTESTELIYNRLLNFKNIIKTKKIKTYACSSIMRISNNNINEEEKEYWSLWGKKIFDYSYNLHKSAKIQSYDANAKYSCIRQTIPTEVLEDYFSTRTRNFEINKMYLEWQKEGIFDYLVFSKDDCAEYGINVSESEQLQEIIDKGNLQSIIKTGADEIPLSLLARAVSDSFEKKIKIFTKYTRPDDIHLISKYEDISVFESVKGQVELSGSVLCENEKDADIILLVNNFEKEQGELVMNVPTKPFGGSLDLPQNPYLIADIAYANGSDNAFVKKLFKEKIDLNLFLGYAGWNTTANTLGSAICAGLVKYLSKKTDVEEFKKQQFVRFADDWAYQANCRSVLKLETNTPNVNKVTALMEPYIAQIMEKIDIHGVKSEYSFPWNRFFEIEIVLD